MFGGDWKEKSSSRIDLNIPDDRITISSLDVVFGSLYRDDITIDPSDVIPLLAASTLLQLESVIQRCSEVMAENLSWKSVIQYLEASERYGLCELKEICVDWLEKHLMFYSSTNQLLQEIWPELMESLVSSPNLFVLQGEIDVYMMLKKERIEKKPIQESCLKPEKRYGYAR